MPAICLYIFDVLLILVIIILSRGLLCQRFVHYVKTTYKGGTLLRTESTDKDVKTETRMLNKGKLVSKC
jgi:hypothetical protein